MKNYIPDKILFHFENANGAIEELIVYYIFKSKIKNNFTIGPKVSDHNGDIILTKELVEETINLNKNDFPMDYGGELSDCELLCILVETKSDLNNRLVRLNEFYPENALILKKIIENASNNEKSLYEEITLPIKNEKINITIVSQK